MEPKQCLFATIGMDVTAVIKRFEEGDEANSTNKSLIVFPSSVVVYFILLAVIKFGILDTDGIGVFAFNGGYILLYIGLFIYCGRSLRRCRERGGRGIGTPQAGIINK